MVRKVGRIVTPVTLVTPVTPVTPARGALPRVVVLLVALAALVALPPGGGGHPLATPGPEGSGDYLRCDGERPKMDLMREMFGRMVRLDHTATASLAGRDRWERIIAIERLSEFLFFFSFGA